jgi:hypothetical protein
MVLADGIEVRASPVVGGGKGLFATVALPAGAMVWREDPEGEPSYTSTPRSAAWVDALPPGAQRAYRHFMCVALARVRACWRWRARSVLSRVAALIRTRSLLAAREPSRAQVQNGRRRVPELAGVQRAAAGALRGRRLLRPIHVRRAPVWVPCVVFASRACAHCRR